MNFNRISGRASLAVSTMALVVAFSSGTAAVASTLVSTKMIKDNAVTSAKVKNGSLTLADFAPQERALLVGP